MRPAPQSTCEARRHPEAHPEALLPRYALCPEDMPQLSEPATRKIFQANFFEAFKGALGKGHVVRTFQDCDFR
jgi:hypothetical protein